MKTRVICRPLLPFLPRAVATLALLAAVVAARAEPRWRLVQTPELTVVSQLDDRSTGRWAEEFSQFIAELRRVFKAPRPHVAPLTVVLFARDRDFARYKPLRTDGRKPQPVDGFFHHRGNWSVIGLANRFDDEATRRLIFHEGVHWFTSNDPVNYPVWLSEGLAEVFSTFRQKDGTVRWGTDIPAHVRYLREEPLLPFEQFLYLTRDDPLLQSETHAGSYYAQAWAFVHYLMFGQRDGSRESLSEYLALLGTGSDPDDAFQQAFGRDYAGMGATLTDYVRDGHYYKVLRPEKQTARLQAEPVSAPPDQVAVALARLALAAGRDDIARAHAEEAVGLAPGTPAGHELIAQLCERAGDHAGALATSRRAVELGSRDASTLFLLAYRLAEEEIHPSNARTIADLYASATVASPTMLEAYRNLAAIAPALDEITDQDLQVLKQGMRLFPHDGGIVLGLADLVARRGDRATAATLLREARRRGLPLDQEAQAARMESNWLYREATERIEVLTRAGDYVSALAVCDETTARVDDIYVRGSLAQLRRTLAFQAELAAIHGLVDAGDAAGARARGQVLLNAYGANPAQRRHVEELLRRLPPAERP